MDRTDIFIVDDERVIAQTLGIILRQQGYRVEVFQDPHAALRSAACAPRLLLTDHDMPGISGCSLASMFKLSHPSIQVLLFSGALSETDLEWQMLTRQSPGIRLLHKPLHPFELLRSIRAALGDAGTKPALSHASSPCLQVSSGAYPPERVMQSPSTPAMMVL